MKIRTDFITNSSTSSFVIMSKESLNEAQLKKELIEALNLSSLGNALLPNLGEDIARALTSYLDYTNIDGYLYDMGYEDVSELKKNNGWGKIRQRVYENYQEYPFIMFSSVSNESDEPMEVMLVDTDIDFKNDKIVVVKDGGY
jgi:hypothetical protein